jgi:hypothetical protein
MILIHKGDPFLAHKHQQYLASKRRKHIEKNFYQRMQQDIKQREDQKQTTRRVSSLSPFRSDTSTMLSLNNSSIRAPIRRGTSKRLQEIQEHIMNSQKSLFAFNSRASPISVLVPEEDDETE